MLHKKLIMPEGDRDFLIWLDQLSAISSALDVQLLLKESALVLSREPSNYFFGHHWCEND